MSEDYSQEGVLAQILVAFGQGTGLTRTSQKAVLAMRGRYLDQIEQHLWEWGENAVQVLERIRTIGKVAVLRATERADTTISEEDVCYAIEAVERESDTSWCPPREK
jgi:histone H3/H4